MYSADDRNTFFTNAVEKISEYSAVEGIIQLGSGVVGYKDDLSDIDLMVAAYDLEDVRTVRDVVRRSLSEFSPVYIKEKQLRENIFLLIVLLENSLEFNVSIVPRELLSVKSPLWRVIVDKTGLVSKKMNEKNAHFNSKLEKYDVDMDLVFEFVYAAKNFDKELKRANIIYALRMLEAMRNITLMLQSLNEKKKFHQFKAYETLESGFISDYLSSYPEGLTVEHLVDSAKKLRVLFTNTLEHSNTFTMDRALSQLLNECFAYNGQTAEKV